MKDSRQNQKVKPENTSINKEWLVGRRNFLKNSVLAGIFSHTLFVEACISNPEKIEPLTKNQYQILQSVQNILFPKDEIGPSAADFHADKYVLWVLNDARIDPEENKFILDGLDWTEETAMEEFGKSYLKLSVNQQNDLVKYISQQNWGENWLSLNLTYIFEAMISDPIYGFNDREQGWEWLEHMVGTPRPNSHNKYDDIFKTLKF
jgi:gluconate 2-dehydrogenase gamma chain